MTQPAKVQEPSMEEILASIRRIIADDEAKPAAAEKPASPVAARPEAPARPSVMKDIPPSAIAPAAAKPAAPKPAPPPPRPAPEPAASNNQDDIDAMLASLDAATPEADIRPRTARRAMCSNSPTRWHCRIRRRRHRSTRSSLRTTSNSASARPPRRGSRPMSRRHSKASRRHNRSCRARPSQPSSSAFNSLANTVLSNNARTLEDLVKEMLRPMLKSWLDDNLPGLVERIVKAEIERVSRGR